MPIDGRERILRAFLDQVRGGVRSFGEQGPDGIVGRADRFPDFRVTAIEPEAPGTRGVTVTGLATVDLAGEIEGMAGRQLRMRMVTIEPGGTLGPAHDHRGRPGLVFILKGTITDHRDGVATDYGPGVGWPEDRDTIHWLENRGSIPAVEISVDIVAEDHA